MPEFVRYTLDNGAEVIFESAESNLVELHGAEPDVVDAGRLQTRLESVAAAAEQVAESLRSRLRPEEISLEFGLKVSGEVNWWFFAKNQAEGTIKVTLTWTPGKARESVRVTPMPSVVRATAAVLVDGRLAGSAVLVDGRHLLTAGHVLRGRDPDGRRVPVDEVALVFPALTDVDGAGTPARRVSIAQGDGPGVDVAVLDLGPVLPDWLPAPVPVWPAERLPARVSVFGFPKAERDLRGVWRTFDVAGPVAGGTIQLDWAGAAGTLPGHSGGPAVDPVTGSLVGVLVEGSTAGRFDRFVSVSMVRRVWPGLPRPWLVAGVEGASHFGRRARGQPSAARGGDLFRGRRAALEAVRSWLTSTESPGRPLVVTGQPGAGKSAVLARAVLGLEAERRTGAGLAFHGRGATHADVLTALADLTGADRATSRDDLLDALAPRTRAEPWLVALDALDEAASAEDRRQIVETLTELATLPDVRVAVATRPLAVGERERYAPGGLLPALGVTSATAANLVDLDTDRYVDSAGLRQFAAALLAQEGADRPGPPGGAWSAYRGDRNLRDRLARVVAERAGRNYLVAAMAGVPLSMQPAPVDPRASDFDVRDVPAGVGDALRRYLGALPDGRRVRIQGLLTALAYARGAGVDDDRWRMFATALGYSAEPIHLAELRESVVADHLLQADEPSPADGWRAGAITRLFHQALADELLAGRRTVDDERRLLSALLAEGRSEGWTAAPRYLRTYLSDHAAAADALPMLLEDTDYVAAADLPRLMSHLVRGTSAAESPMGRVIRQAGNQAAALPSPRRTWLFAVTAAHLGLRDLHHRIAARCADPLRLRWAHSLGSFHQELPDQTRDTSAAALGRVHGRDVIVTGGKSGVIRGWDADSGQPAFGPFPGHTDWISALALGRLGDRDILASAGGLDDPVLVRDLPAGDVVAALPAPGGARIVAIHRIGDRDVVVTAGHDTIVRVWDASTGAPVGAPLTGHRYGAVAVETGVIGGRSVVVSVGQDGTVLTWEPLSGRLVGDPVGPVGGVRLEHLAIGRIGGRHRVVCARVNGKVLIRDAASGRSVLKLKTHDYGVEAVAVSRIEDRDAVVTVDRVGTVRVWDALDGSLVREFPTGSTARVEELKVGRAGGREIIVPVFVGEPVRIWEASGQEASPAGLPGHLRPVTAVATGRVDGNPVVVSGDENGTVRLWNAESGRPVRGVARHRGYSRVNHLGIAEVKGRTVIVAATWDSHITVWDARFRPRCDPTPFRGDPHGDADDPDPVTALAIGAGIVVSTHRSRSEVEIRRMRNLRPIGTPLPVPGVVRALTVGRFDGHEVIVAGMGDGRVRIWRHRNGVVVGKPVTVPADDGVTAVAVGTFGHRDAIVIGESEGTLRIWTGHRRRLTATTLPGHSGDVTAIATGRIGGHDVIVSAGADQTVRIWRASTGKAEAVLDFLRPPEAVALAEDGTLCVATGTAVCALGTLGTLASR